ncbi:hypothetical protein Gpo141_00002171 [Globisporangium polare]
MDKITKYMRVTKKRKAPEEEKGGALYKPPPSTAATHPPRALALVVPVKKPAPTSTSPEPQQQYYRHEDHVPEFIYKVVKYVRRGQGEKVSKDELVVVKYIETHYCVPADLECDHKFGPHSGLTFEKRLTRAYSLKLLKPKDLTKLPEPICPTCTQMGHFQRDCPDGF